MFTNSSVFSTQRTWIITILLVVTKEKRIHPKTQIIVCDFGNSKKMPRTALIHVKNEREPEFILEEKMEVADLSKPDETRTFEKGKLDLVKIGGSMIGRGKFEPGWRWSKHVKPIAKTESCEASHFQYHLSGVLHVQMDDGTEKDVGPGEISFLPSGHDAWVVGNEPVVVVDFQGMRNYAKQ